MIPYNNDTKLIFTDFFETSTLTQIQKSTNVENILYRYYFFVFSNLELYLWLVHLAFWYTNFNNIRMLNSSSWGVGRWNERVEMHSAVSYFASLGTLHFLWILLFPLHIEYILYVHPSWTTNSGRATTENPKGVLRHRWLRWSALLSCYHIVPFFTPSPPHLSSPIPCFLTDGAQHPEKPRRLPRTWSIPYGEYSHRWVWYTT